MADFIRAGDNWKCPYCGLGQVISDDRLHQAWRTQWAAGWKDKRGRPGVFVRSIVCANDACRELTLIATLGTAKGGDDDEVMSPFRSWKLLPPSSAKPQPDCIPKPIRDDYEEACAIRDLSPKASATLTRRCLQGMIRDFCGIAKNRLIDEIGELRKRVQEGNAPTGVTSDSVEAIDHVRGIGNIGAHMEKDIDVIVDVDPGEAQILIELVENLFDEWYIAREARIQRFAKLKAIAEEKAQKKRSPEFKPAK